MFLDVSNFLNVIFSGIFGRERYGAVHQGPQVLPRNAGHRDQGAGAVQQHR